MPRAVKEWIGKTPDTPAPPRVKDRVLIAFHFRCHWSGRIITPGTLWDTDHIVAIINGGENRESNLAPIIRGKEHKEKTRIDVALKKQTYRKRIKIYRPVRGKSKWPKRKLASKPFPKRWRYADEA